MAENNAAFDSLWWSRDAFKGLYEETNDPKWLKAQLATEYNILSLSSITGSATTSLEDSVAAVQVQGINLIPASTEWGYDPDIVFRQEFSNLIPENSNQTNNVSDWTVSIDALETDLPNIKRVCLVVAWFGDDLRCGNCTIRPKVEIDTKVTTPYEWSVAGLTRNTALVVTQSSGSSAYGSTPNDDSVKRAILDLKSRGFTVMFYPFIMMDIASGNTLPNPYSDNASTLGQPAYPWRGRITVSPSRNYAGTVDQTATADIQVSNFVGTINPPSTEWSFRRMILHYANLCSEVGGVDQFCIGTEMVEMTRVRGASGFPFVDALVTLSDDVRAILPDTEIGYAADWSEYNNFRPGNAIYFNLDPLWAHINIDFIGIDNYTKLSDKRDGDGIDIYDLDYLKSNIEGGEDYDYFYASQSDRDALIQSPISDFYNQPWVYRQKDFKNWWSNQHYERLTAGAYDETLVENVATSGSQYDASIAGSPIRNNPSEISGEGHYLLLDGSENQYPYIENDILISTFTPTSTHTIELWFKAITLTGNHIIYEQGGTEYGFNIFTVNTELRCGYWLNNTEQYYTTNTITTGVWYHVVFVYIGGAVKVYLNGALEHNVSSPITFNIEYLEGTFIDGGIDNIVLYTSELNPTRIASHHSNPIISNILSDNPLVFWTFDIPNTDGSPSEIATAWVPQSKPIYFTELGFPAVDKATNQPNVFFDPKSTESNLPYYSNGTRDDKIQRLAIQAHYEYWQNSTNNPTSTIYGGKMLDTSHIYIWAWDARPYPAFPDSGVWADSTNYELGHWLNGRLGSPETTGAIDNLTHWYKEENKPVFAYPGSQIVQVNNANGYSATRVTTGTFENYAQIDINASIGTFPSIELQNFAVTIGLEDDSIVNLNIGSNIVEFYEIVLSDVEDDFNTDNLYRTYLNITSGNTIFNFRFTPDDFVNWTKEGIVWHPKIAQNPVYLYNGATGSATEVYSVEKINGENSLIGTYVLDAGSDFGGMGLNMLQTVPTEPPHLFMSVSGTDVILRIVDGSGVTWEKTISATVETLVSRTIATDLALTNGDQIIISATEDSGEYCLIDYIELTQKFGANTIYRIQSDQLELSNYSVVSYPAASNGTVISLINNGTDNTGTANYTFNLPEGNYDVNIRYVDSINGVGTLTVNHYDVETTISNQLDTWQLNQDSGPTFVIDGYGFYQYEWADMEYSFLNAIQPQGSITPNFSDPIQELKLDGTTGGTTVKFRYAIDKRYNFEDFKLDAPATIYKASVRSSLDYAHTLYIGDFYPTGVSIQNLNYTPGVVPFTVNTTDGVVDAWRGIPMSGYQDANVYYELNEPTRVENVLDFLLAAQDAYAAQDANGDVGPFMPAYSWEYWDTADYALNGINNFGWNAPDPNTGWVGYQFRPLEAIAKYWANNRSDTKAERIVMRFLSYLDRDLLERNGYNPLTNFYPVNDPTSEYHEPHAGALLLRAAMYANLAGGNAEITFRLITRMYDYIKFQYQSSGLMTGSFTADQPSFSESGSTYQEYFGFWHFEIVETLALLIQNKDNITYPGCDTVL